MKKIKRGLLFSFALAAVTFMSIPEGKEIANGISARNQLLRLAPTETERQYIGYGYDVTGGVAICDTDALMLNNPILDVDSDELLPLMKSFDASQTTYISNTTASASEISESYGIALSGGVRGSVSAINLNVATSFNTNIGWSKSSTKTEEYSYHTILAKNKTVVLQANTKQLRDHLNPRFLADALAVNNVEDAKQLIKTYGTHLLTGYTLGGLFELTNYFATDSSSYVRELSVGFDSQVGATISAMNVQTDFSFAMNYGLKDNNSHAVNNYKCTTFGGLSFPGLTIDQAFKYYETAFGAGYIYQIWTDSINEGKNLVICDIPQSSKMIPIWEILPVTGEFNLVKANLIDAYMTLAADGLTNHRSNYPDIVNSISLPELEAPSFKLNGFSYFAGEEDEAYSRYVAVQDQKTPQVMTNYIVALDYNEGAYKGLDVNWKVVPESRATMLDNRSGVFKVTGTVDQPTFRVEAYVGDTSTGKKVFSKNFNIIDVIYSSGSGIQNDPYVIDSPDQILNLSNRPSDWNKCFELAADIDLSALNSTQLAKLRPIGNRNTKFSGQFDGGYHTIKNLTLDTSYFDKNGCSDFGLFGLVTEKAVIKKLNIDAFDFSFSKTSSTDSIATSASRVVNIGILAGLFESGAVVDECSISNSIIDFNAVNITKGTLDNSYTTNLNGGAVAGTFNGGSFTNIHVNNCVIDICGKTNTSASTSGGGLTYAGGFVGFATANRAEIRYCSVKGTNVIAGDNALEGATCDAGGFVGRATTLKLEDCLVSSPREISTLAKKATYLYRAFVIADLYNDGTDDLKSILSRVLVVNAISDSFNNKSSKYTGLVIGYLKSNNANNISAQDVVVEDISNSDTTYTILGILSGQSTKELAGCSKQTNLRWYNGTPSSIVQSDKWESDDEGFPSIIVTVIDKELFEFDFSKVKTTFLVGESFKTGDISITGYDAEGNSFPVYSYYVNYNAFDKTQPGTYTIFVSTSGASSSYEVKVEEATRASIRAELMDRQFYQYETVDKNCFTVYSIDDLGEEELMSIDEYTISTSKTLNKGDNLVTISTIDGKFSTQVVVYAKERKLRSLDWFDEAPEISVVYGSRDISLKGESFILEFNEGEDITMTFKTDKLLEAKFKVGGRDVTYELDANIVDLIVPSIKYGNDNVGYLCYGDYDVDPLSFKVIGLGAPTQDEIDSFVAKVNEVYDPVNGISSDLTLEEAHRLILEANKLLESFGDYRNDGINTAIDNLNEAINAYNLKAEGINAEIEQGIFILSSFNYELLAKAGVVSFSLIIALILLVF